jgi:carbonic anhydrase
MSDTLLDGLERFRQEYFPRYEEHYRRLIAEGQSPSTLFVGCSDSRVLPDHLTGSRPGDLFVTRNIGNVVPPYEDEEGYNGVAAAIEYAVVVLRVRNIVVCGHTHCGAIRALYRPPPQTTRHISKWMELAEPARLPGELTDELLRQTEQRSIVLQLSRLMGFPGVLEGVESGRIALHGWHYVIEEGTVLVLDLATQAFVAPHELLLSGRGWGQRGLRMPAWISRAPAFVHGAR